MYNNVANMKVELDQYQSKLQIRLWKHTSGPLENTEFVQTYLHLKMSKEKQTGLI